MSIAADALPKIGRLLLAHEIEIARRKVGLSIEDVALLAELPATTVEQLETGGRFRGADNLRVKATLASYGVNFARDLRRGRGSL